jgi:mono/diheme cytochrome c family protein
MKSETFFCASFSLLLVLVLSVLSLPLAAQQANTSGQITDTQKQGQLLFNHHCSVCHVRAPEAKGTYGPILDKTMVAGNEASIRDIISGGVGRMPGFQYGLRPNQIDSIIQYLKTLEKPAEKGTSNGPVPADN